MHILITGGTGLIGSALCRHWSAQGHVLTVLSRRPEAVLDLCGANVHGIARLEDYGDGPLDTVVNLAGEPIADQRWTARRKQAIRDSRIALTESLVSWLANRPVKPARLISGSAVGWYGDGGDRELNENSAPASSDFASQLCQDWEDAARKAEVFGIVVATVRTGLVLAATGGMLAKMRLPFRLGLGGRIGDGRQWMPWIHLRDQIRILDFLLHIPDASGAWNATAPQPVTNAAFTAALAKAVHRPAVLPVPAAMLRLGMGELASLLLGGQHALPSRLIAAGFRFDFPELQPALEDVLQRLPDQRT